MWEFGGRGEKGDCLRVILLLCLLVITNPAEWTHSCPLRSPAVRIFQIFEIQLKSNNTREIYQLFLMAVMQDNNLVFATMHYTNPCQCRHLKKKKMLQVGFEP